jgi:hypothetical protein
VFVPSLVFFEVYKKIKKSLSEAEALLADCADEKGGSGALG